ncbi:MAG: hypothetical protein FWE06_09945 [Oscillospiraceae bacterium]|nr:hypothetical protein [Oscillospiraceae bacterium]
MNKAISLLLVLVLASALLVGCDNGGGLDGTWVLQEARGDGVRSSIHFDGDTFTLTELRHVTMVREHSPIFGQSTSTESTDGLASISSSVGLGFPFGEDFDVLSQENLELTSEQQIERVRFLHQSVITGTISILGDRIEFTTEAGLVRAVDFNQTRGRLELGRATLVRG